MIKKLILLGFGLTLLIGLPLAIFVLQNQTQPTTHANPVTKFSFDGSTSVNNGQTFDKNVIVDPGTNQNQVSFVKFTFTYDPNFLDTTGTKVDIDQTKYTILEQPAISCATLCTVTRTISIGANQTSVIKSPTPVATIHFIAKANTDTNGTQLLFPSGGNQALSVGSADQAAENVFNTGVPATILIGQSSGAGGGTPTVTPTPTPANFTGPGGGGNGGGTGGSSGGTGGTSGGTGGSSGTSVSVTCSSFTVDKQTGNPPLTTTFTTVGSSPNDSIAKIAVTYGDGSADTVSSGSGIGTGNINNQISHTYVSNGTYTANALLSTTGGATSTPTSCQQIITVGTTAPTPTPLANGKLPPTGPGQTILIIGAVGGLLTAVGAVVLFSL